MPALIRTAVCLLTYALAYSAFAATPDRSAEPSGQYLKEWLLCGPFPALAEAEKNIDAIRLPGMYTDCLAGPRRRGQQARPVAGRWYRSRAVRARGNAMSRRTNAVDLDAAITKADRVVAYAYCRDRLARSNRPAFSLWAAMTASAPGSTARPSSTAPGRAACRWTTTSRPWRCVKGRNSLLLKIEERGNRWAFRLPLPAAYRPDRPGQAPAPLRGRLARRRHAGHPRAPIAGASRRRC